MTTAAFDNPLMAFSGYRCTLNHYHNPIFYTELVPNFPLIYVHQSLIRTSLILICHYAPIMNDVHVISVHGKIIYYRVVIGNIIIKRICKLIKYLHIVWWLFSIHPVHFRQHESDYRLSESEIIASVMTDLADPTATPSATKERSFLTAFYLLPIRDPFFLHPGSLFYQIFHINF